MQDNAEINLNQAVKLLSVLKEAFQGPGAFLEQDILFRMENLLQHIYKYHDDLNIKQASIAYECSLFLCNIYLNKDTLIKSKAYMVITKVFIEPILAFKEIEEQSEIIFNVFSTESAIASLEKDPRKSISFLTSIIDFLESNTPDLLSQEAIYSPLINGLLENIFRYTMRKNRKDYSSIQNTLEEAKPFLNKIISQISINKTDCRNDIEIIFSIITQMIEALENGNELKKTKKILLRIHVSSYYHNLLKDNDFSVKTPPDFIIKYIGHTIAVDANLEPMEQVSQIHQTIGSISQHCPSLFMIAEIQNTTLKALFYAHFQSVKKFNDPDSIFRAIQKMELILKRTIQSANNPDQIKALFNFMVACIQDIQKKSPQQSNHDGDILFFCKSFYALLNTTSLPHSSKWYPAFLKSCNLHAKTSSQHLANFFSPSPPVGSQSISDKDLSDEKIQSHTLQ